MRWINFGPFVCQPITSSIVGIEIWALFREPYRSIPGQIFFPNRVERKKKIEQSQFTNREIHKRVVFSSLLVQFSVSIFSQNPSFQVFLNICLIELFLTVSDISRILSLVLFKLMHWIWIIESDDSIFLLYSFRS